MPIRKNSKKRQVILEALAATTAHPTAQELYQQLKPDYPDLSLGTVYRNLSLFSEQGDVMSVTDAQVLGCSITFTGLCKACQQAAKEAASE